MVPLLVLDLSGAAFCGNAISGIKTPDCKCRQSLRFLSSKMGRRMALTGVSY